MFSEYIANKLSLGQKAGKYVAQLIERHLDVFRLMQLKEAGELTNKDLNLFWFKNKHLIPHLFILSFADAYATSEDDEFLKRVKLFIIFLQEYFFDIYSKEIVEEPFISGKEIMNILNLSPSPIIGEIKKNLLKKQIAGEVKNKDEAIRFVKSFKL